MAMQKAENWPYGGTQPTANYHTIVNTNTPSSKVHIRVIVESFYNAAAYTAGDKPYKQRTFTLPLADHVDLSDIMLDNVAAPSSDLWTELYDAIQLSDENGGFFKTGVTDV